MEILDGDVLYKAILRRYSNDPTGWSFSVSPSRSHNFFDAFITGPEDSWQLKLDTIFKPSPLVLGSKVEGPAQKGAARTSPVSFGFRRVPPEALPALFSGTEDSRHLLALLGSLKPVAPNAAGSYVEGPIMYTGKAATGSPDQQRLDEKLSSELLKLVRKRFPSYG